MVSVSAAFEISTTSREANQQPLALAAPAFRVAETPGAPSTLPRDGIPRPQRPPKSRDSDCQWPQSLPTGADSDDQQPRGIHGASASRSRRSSMEPLCSICASGFLHEPNSRRQRRHCGAGFPHIEKALSLWLFAAFTFSDCRQPKHF